MKVIAIYGHTDAIRWGDLGMDGNHRRRFHLDLLSGSLRLYDIRAAEKRGEEYADEDTDPEHLAQAREVLQDVVRKGDA